MVYATKPLSRLAVEASVAYFANNPRCTGHREVIEQLPLRARLDVLGEMCDYPSLIDVQFEILSDPMLISDFLSHLPVSYTPLVQCVQWLQSVNRSLPTRLVQLYRGLSSRHETDPRLDFRCGLRIGMFLAQTGWLTEAIAILRMSCDQVSGVQQLMPLSQLLRAESLAGMLDDAKNTQLLTSKLMHKIERTGYWNRARQLKVVPSETIQYRDLQRQKADVFHSHAVYLYESRNFDLSLDRGLDALRKLDDQSPSRLVIDVYRQLAKVHLRIRRFASAALMLEHALARARRDFGRVSAPYAETLEDVAIYLLARGQIGESVDIYADAQHLYTQLYGARNLLLGFAQGNLAYGLCVQAYVTWRAAGMLPAYRRHMLAMKLFRKTIANYESILPADHRMLVQMRRLCGTISCLISCLNISTPPDDVDESGLLDAARSTEHKDEPPLSVAAVRCALYDSITGKGSD